MTETETETERQKERKRAREVAFISLVNNAVQVILYSKLRLFPTKGLLHYTLKQMADNWTSTKLNIKYILLSNQLKHPLT